jgi:opacity protein-like surface antigen
LRSSSGSGDPNITRWLFLALQGDVGGFGAGSQIAWLASGTVGINITRNVFVETGYRYFYKDYKNGGFLYKAAEAGLFMGLGVKF